MEFLVGLTYWHWWILGLTLIILEMFAPGAFFLWLGVSAGIVGALVLVIPTISWQIQLLLFAALSIASIVAWKAYLRRRPTQTDQPALNRRGEQYIGRTFTLQDPIVNGVGKVQVDDSTWRVRGENYPRGTQVRVTGTDGAVLKVEKA